MLLRGTRVLVIEDVAEAREGLQHLLRLEGADVVTSATGDEAVRTINKERPDVIVTDLDLPDMPGETLIATLRETFADPPRVVVVSGAEEPRLRRAREAGAEVVLPKPVRFNLLLAFLARREPGLAA